MEKQINKTFLNSEEKYFHDNYIIACRGVFNFNILNILLGIYFIWIIQYS